jgi:hypothetical protein
MDRGTEFSEPKLRLSSLAQVFNPRGSEFIIIIQQAIGCALPKPWKAGMMTASLC